MQSSAHTCFGGKLVGAAMIAAGQIAALPLADVVNFMMQLDQMVLCTAKKRVYRGRHRQEVSSAFSRLYFYGCPIG